MYALMRLRIPTGHQSVKQPFSHIGGSLSVMKQILMQILPLSADTI